VFSPFLRGHDIPARAGTASHGRSGCFRDALHEVGAALEDPRAVPVAVTADGDLVRAVVQVTGRLTRELFGRAPTGTAVAVGMALTFRFDDSGLVVEYWQDLSTTSGFVD
jgi:hypothetical protein